MRRPEYWWPSHRFDRRALPLADRHYNRQKPGSPQFCPPGTCMVLLTPEADALWVTSWPLPEYTKHAWPGAWINSCFRSEAQGRLLSSELIREAVATTLGFHRDNPKWAARPLPPLGMVTFVDAAKTRHKRDVGRCYRKAGFKHVGFTKGGLWAFQMLPAQMPESASFHAPLEVEFA